MLLSIILFPFSAFHLSHILTVSINSLPFYSSYLIITLVETPYSYSLEGIGMYPGDFVFSQVDSTQSLGQITLTDQLNPVLSQVEHLEILQVLEDSAHCPHAVVVEGQPL